MNIIAPRSERIARAAQQFKMKTQGDYERILDELANIRLEKVRLYGESRYEETDQDFSMTGVQWDLYRKFIRLKQLFKLGWRTEQIGESLRDTLMDLANYAIMGVQLLDSYLKPGSTPEDTEYQRTACGKCGYFLGIIGTDGLCSDCRADDGRNP